MARSSLAMEDEAQLGFILHYSTVHAELTDAGFSRLVNPWETAEMSRPADTAGQVP